MKKIDRLFASNNEVEEIKRGGRKPFLVKFKEFWIRSYYETKLSIKAETKKQFFIDMLWMILGNTVLAFGTQVFIINNELITGGVSGISIIIGWLSPDGLVDINLIITIITWALFFIGLLLLGLKFAFKTLVATIIFPPLLYLFSMLVKEFPWLSLSNDGIGMLLGAVFGGFCVGTGCGFTFIGGGSTGGVDCLSLAANKYLHIKTSIMAFFIDASIILIGFIVKKDSTLCLIGIVSAFVAAIMIDKVFIGQTSSYIAFIVSEKSEKISDRINSELERGTTLFSSEGGFTRNRRYVVQVVFDRKEYRDIKNIIAEIDPKAFVTIMHAYEVNGYGFKKLKKNKFTLNEIIAEDKKRSFGGKENEDE